MIFANLSIGTRFWKVQPTPERQFDDQALIKIGPSRYIAEDGMFGHRTDGGIDVASVAPHVLFKDLSHGERFRFCGYTYVKEGTPGELANARRYVNVFIHRDQKVTRA